MSSPTSSLKRPREGSPPPLSVKRQRSASRESEVRSEWQLNIERRLMSIQQNLARNFDRIDARLQHLENRMDPLATKVDQMYAKFLEVDEEATPVISFEDESQVHPALMALFEGCMLPMREIALTESESAYTKKLERETARIARQVEAQNSEMGLIYSSRFFVDLLDKNQVKDLDDVKWDGNVFATTQGAYHANEDTSVSFEMDTPQGAASVYAVFDGHGGGQASAFCCAHLESTLSNCLKQLCSDGKDYEIANALKIAFVRLDAAHRMHMLLNYPERKNPGTTACLTMIIGKKLFVATCGDSRAILCSADGSSPRQLSYDFKASDQYATETVTRRGGEVVFRSGTMRVQGSLAVTRAIGNEHLRKDDGEKVISPRPKVMQVDLDKGDYFLSLMSDGVTDKVLPKFLAQQIGALHAAHKTPEEMAKLMVQGAKMAGSKDDITLGIIPLSF